MLLDSTLYAAEIPEAIDYTRTLKDAVQATAGRLREPPSMPACCRLADEGPGTGLLQVLRLWSTVSFRSCQELSYVF